MARKPKIAGQDLFNIAENLRTAVCVPNIRTEVLAWREAGYAGVTKTTKTLLNHWFYQDHVLKNGRRFNYHTSQRDALEALVYIWEVKKIRNRKDLLETFASKSAFASGLALPRYDQFARFATKMATGSGKTKVMSLAIAWQYLNAMCEDDHLEYAKTFLIIAPNVIVLERLSTDFIGGRIFTEDPVLPKSLRVFWDLECFLRGDGERASAEGALFVTNVQQLYLKPEEAAPANPLEVLLGNVPKAQLQATPKFLERIYARSGQVMVLNDEAHHTHDEDSVWNQTIRELHSQTPLVAQLDLSATPRFTGGALFPWVISDYPLKQAILDNIVKRPVQGVTKASEALSDIASVKYQAFLTAGVQRWREYKRELEKFKKKPVLFVMLNKTAEADDVADWMRTKYPSEFAGDQLLVIHTNQDGDISTKDLELARRASREIDAEKSPVNAVVSVLMLREGWDVKNVTVVVGLRPYSAKADILPEQAIGRGLRLMFRGENYGFTERVDIIGTPKFLEFVQKLDALEDVKLETVDLDKDKLEILAIEVMQDKLQFDIAFPMLSPTLARKKSIALEIAALNVHTLKAGLPLKPSSQDAKQFKYEGKDVLTLETLFKRDYEIPVAQTPGEVIGYFAKMIADSLKMTGQFAVIAPKVREWFEHRAFNGTVNLESPDVLKAMSSNVAGYVVREEFVSALRPIIIEERSPEVLSEPRKLSSLEPIPWSRGFVEAKKSVLNVNPCGNEFEKEFCRFLDAALDVVSHCKIPDSFGFYIEYTDASMNLRHYYPDFVAIDQNGVHWLLETKGAETLEVSFKDKAAKLWCENATALSGIEWKYLKIPQKNMKTLKPDALEDLQVFS
jgi:type III restriction enzyme